jgi:site-specific DNA recombinase
MVPKMTNIAKNYQDQPTTRKRALAYVRISSQRQINGESPETQRTYIKEYADRNNIDIADTFYDEAKSGKNTDRSELQSMIRYAQKHKDQLDYVIVYKMNRASRDMASYVTGFLMPLRNLGISVRSATEPIDDSVFGQFMEGLSILVGQMDNATKTGFTVDNMTALALQGYWQHPPIVGYDTHRIANDIGKLRPTLKPSSMAPLVKDVLERFSEGNITKAELTRYASGIGLRSRYGKKLTDDRINFLIKNPVYAGYIVDNFTKGELIQGKHEAIISTETYEINQTLLYGKRKRLGEVHQMFNPDYPLKGLVLCPNCTKPLYASAPKTGAGGKSPRYHCSRTPCKGKYKSIKADVMHDDFEDMLKRIKPDERVIQLYKEVLITESANQLGSLNGRISKLRGKLDTIADNRLSAIKKFNTDQLTASEKTDLVSSLDEEKAVLHGELRKLEGQQTVRETDIELALDVMRDVDKQWVVASPASKMRFQSVLFPKGLVYDYENHRFGTSQISSLYRCIPTKKDLPESEKSFLVAGAGFEPATCWL